MRVKKTKKQAPATVEESTAVEYEALPEAGKYEDLPIEARLVGHQMARLSVKLMAAKQEIEGLTEERDTAIAARDTLAKQVPAPLTVTASVEVGIAFGVRLNPTSAHHELVVVIDDDLVKKSQTTDYRRSMLYFAVGRVVKQAMDLPPFNLTGKPMSGKTEPSAADLYPGSTAGVTGGRVVAPPMGVATGIIDEPLGDTILRRERESMMRAKEESYARFKGRKHQDLPVNEAMREATEKALRDYGSVPMELSLKQLREAPSMLDLISRMDSYRRGLHGLTPVSRPSLMGRLKKFLTTHIGDLF